MGKWTLEYHDNVLRDKFKSMVNGAIKRTVLEKGEPNITYESFVADLDAGDSFTSTLIDILVKELAERRTRPHSSDRRLISERTAKALRIHGARSPLYHGRRLGPASRSTQSERVFSPPDYDPPQHDDNPDQIDNYHVNLVPSLSDANQRAEESSSTGTRTLFLDAQGPTTETVTSPAPVSSPRPWVPGPLIRQNSMRRQNRSRMSDFNEFTYQRRSVLRTSSQTSDGDRSDNPFGFSPSQRPQTDLSVPVESSDHLQFLPLAALTDAQYHPDSSALNASDDRTTMPAVYFYRHSHYNTQYPPLPLPSWGTTSSQPNASTIPPRLRRGGLRAPETLVQSHSTSENAPSSSSAPSSISDSLLALSHIPRPSTVPVQVIAERTVTTSADEASNQLLTPRSVSPAEENSL